MAAPAPSGGGALEVARAYSLLLPAFLLTVGCGRLEQVEVRFRSAAIRDAVREVGVFVFGPTEDGSHPGCAELDPRGLGPGDAEARTGRTADRSARGPLAGDLASFPDVPPGVATVVVEAWGPGCEAARVPGPGEDPVCDRLASSGPSVLRGYECATLELGAGAPLDLTLPLQTFALLGARMELPSGLASSGAGVHDGSRPLLLSEGELARDRLAVRLTDHRLEPTNGVLVHWSVSPGLAAFAEGARSESVRDGVLGEGISSVTTRAALFAAGEDGGRMSIFAHAPGWDGSPYAFQARALPGVAVVLEQARVPSEALLRHGSPSAQPLVLGDLDGDGRLDVVTVGGGDQHRLIVLYGAAGASPEVAYSELVPLEARALALARLAPGAAPSVVISTVRYGSQRLEDTPDGRTFVVESPSLEVWSGLAARPAGGRITVEPRRLTSLSGAPITKAAIAMHAGDIDGDGVDELALSRCSYTYYVGGIGQSSYVNCHARLSDKTDSEIAVLRSAGGAEPDFEVLATVPAEGNDGGFRDVRLMDLNGDGSLDLVFVSDTQILGLCGRRNQPGDGFGFRPPNRRFAEGINIASGYSVAAGRFADRPGLAAVASGSNRARSPISGFRMVPASGCGFETGPPAVISGAKTLSYLVQLRVADLNGDGWDDILVLHRAERELRIFFGGGEDALAPGPAIELPASNIGRFDVGVEEIDGERTVLAAIAAPADDAIFLLRFTPLR